MTETFFFLTPKEILMYANKRENGAADFIFFFSPKDTWQMFRQLQEKRSKHIAF